MPLEHISSARPLTAGYVSPCRAHQRRHWGALFFPHSADSQRTLELSRLRQRGEGGKVKWDTHRLKVHIEARMKNIPSPIPPNPKVIPTFIKKSLIPSFLGVAGSSLPCTPPEHPNG